MKNITYINAGAGSGKTYTLTKLLSDKLSDRSVPIVPSQVILTTFTELAAAEFREKARQALLKSGNIEAASQIDSAAMGTVHAVAFSFIRKFWYLLEYGADIQPISKHDERFYMSQSLDRIVSDPKHKEDLQNFRRFRDYYNIKDEDSHPDYLFWQDVLRNVVDKMEYYHVDEVETSIQKSIDTLRAVFVEQEATPEVFKGLLDFLRAYRAYCLDKTNKKNNDKANRHIRSIDPLLKGVEHIHQMNDVIANLKEPVDEKTIEQKCPGYTDFLSTAEMLYASKSELNILIPYVTSIFHVALDWRNDYIAYKKRNHIISYNDMEQLFLRLLEEEEEVQDYVRAHYRLVMVDEFQDSNPIQLKIFNRLSELVATVDGHSYWVGDPKQAIYGFRGADTELVNSVAKYFKFYEDAEIHPEEGEHHLGSGRLTESWRSRAKLVELVNDMFTEPFKSDGIDERLIPLSPHFKNDTLPAIPLEHWVSKAGNEALRGEAIAFRVKQLLESHVEVHHGLQNEATDSIQPKDIAILCRANENCASLINALRKYGVPVSSSETDILPRIEVQFVISLLRFIQNPRSKSTIADLRRLLWSETPEAILKDRIQYLESLPEVDEEGNKPSDEWCQDWESVQTLLSRTAHYKELSIPDMVRALIYDTNLPALCAKWGDQDTRCQNLSTLQQLADDYDHMCLQMGLGTSINGFIDYLNTIQPDREQDNQSNTVKVFTYHGSKGLEWPVVILTELDKDSVFPSTLIKRGFMTVRECVLEDCATEQDPFAKKYFLHYFPYVVKPGKSSNPPDHLMALIMRVDIYQQLQNRTAAEERRLLYVGITRAKDCLYTFSKPNSNLKWLSNVGIENTNSSNPWGKPEYQPELVELYTPDDNDIPASPTTYTMVEKPETHQERPARYLSPSKIGQYAGYNAHRTWSEHGAPITTQGWGNDYARIGTCIHDLFAVYRHGDDAFNRQAARSVISGHGLSSQLSGHIEAILAAARWLHDTLQQKYPQLQPSGLQREHPFIQTLPNGQTLRGEMDLVWQYTAADGTPHAILVDYKTFPGVDLNAHTPQYYAQLSAYASALADEGIQVDAALIYYPVHGTIHELVKQ